jgi:hypothetical protein
MGRRIYELLFVARFAPKAKDMASLIVRIDGVVANLSAGLVPDSAPEKVFQNLKQVYEKEKKSVPIKNGVVAQEDWNQISKNDKIKSYQEMNAIGHALMGLDFPNMRVGKMMLWVFVALLAGAAIVYVNVHKVATGPSSQIGETEQPGTRIDVIEASKLLTLVQVELDAVENADDAGNQWNIVSDRCQKLLAILRPASLSLNTMKYAGELEAYIDARKPGEVKARLESLAEAVMEDFREQPGRYFWVSGPKRWLEIAFWAYFGVLVGVIFYLAQQLKQGMFDRQDIPSMIGEIVIAPIVTCVVFFLFAYTGITEFSSTDTSIFIVLGFSFIFGYAIRRTVGLLDSLKRRILPEP